MNIVEYNELNDQMEKNHAAVHIWVGEDMSDLPSATNDPVFFLLHAEVDRRWSDWQAANPLRAHTYFGAKRDLDRKYHANSSSVSDIMDMYNVSTYVEKLGGNQRVKDLFQTKDWCYGYSTRTSSK